MMAGFWKGTARPACAARPEIRRRRKRKAQRYAIVGDVEKAASATLLILKMLNPIIPKV